MRVRGRSGRSDAADYAREVADRIAERLTLALKDTSSDTVLPDPVDFADAVESVVAYLPKESSNELAALLSPFWTGARVREALGVPTRQALDSRRRNGSVLAVKTTDGALRYPLFQFQRRNGTVEVKPDLIPTLRALSDFDSWTVGVFLHTPSPSLGGLTPLGWVHHSNDPAVLTRFVQHAARNWAAGTGAA